MCDGKELVSKIGFPMSLHCEFETYYESTNVAMKFEIEIERILNYSKLIKNN